jgi:hypothetical protein
MSDCTYIPGDLAASGDKLYGPRACNQNFVDWVWDAYDFDKGDWDDGFGWDEACNISMPLARTFNAIWALEYSAPDPYNESYSMPIINWAGRYSRSCIDELDGRCGDGTAYAYTTWGVIIDNKTELYMSFFYDLAAAVRAGTIIHEARHADWTGHDDENRDTSWDYNGAWRFHVCWLAWFMNQCPNTSPAMKSLARQRANSILGSMFTSDPGFRIDVNGFAV